ncbi:unnamed protein product [Triticum turgidum subsp. durum]|uniref:Poly(A) polymerase nucleotidyltransferase domain-containing protein n=1 Tax=Triticum turgidum subsp. durum TaxID=4567 RepID=A0A9R1NIP4_TRITD|nr:unnamed protein product [Triticum turgidum subsp. durum]
MTSSAPTSFPKRKLGVTPAGSFDGPLEADLHSTQELEQLLAELGLYKSEETARQEEVLRKLDKIVKEWVKELAIQRGQVNTNVGLFTFGSYHLGVDEPGADIDTLCVGPKYVNCEVSFFLSSCAISVVYT